MLEQVIIDFNMKVANTLTICEGEGQWTRVNKKNSGERSIIDYLVDGIRANQSLRHSHVIQAIVLYF